MDLRSRSSLYTYYPFCIEQPAQVARNGLTTQLYLPRGEDETAAQQLLERQAHQILQVSTWQLQGIQKPWE